MLNATYPDNYMNTGVRTPQEQAVYNAERRNREGTTPLKVYLQNLNADELAVMNELAKETDITNFTPEDVATILGFEPQRADTIVSPSSSSATRSSQDK